jgi:hypothetical protein
MTEFLALLAAITLETLIKAFVYGLMLWIVLPRARN